MAFFQMGPNTLPVPMTLFRDNRCRLVEALREEKEIDDRSYVLLQGGNDKSLYDTDVDYVFRQESYFNYLFGVREPGCYGAVHVQSGRSILFVPRLPEEYAIWMGRLPDLSDYQSQYLVHEVRYTDEERKFESFSESSELVLPRKTKKVKRRSKSTRHVLKLAEKTLMKVGGVLNADDEWDFAGKKIAYDLRNMDERQRIIVEKIISDVVFFGKLNLLGEDYSITPGTPYRHT